MESLVLLALYNSDLSGYGIKSYIDKNYGLFFSSSMGSIYPVLKKLEKKNYVEVSSSFSEGGQKKTIYKLSDEGKKLFIDKMISPMPKSIHLAETEFIVRSLGLSLLDDKNRLESKKNLKRFLDFEIIKIEKAIKDKQNKKIDEVQRLILKFSEQKLNDLQKKSQLLDSL